MEPLILTRLQTTILLLGAIRDFLYAAAYGCAAVAWGLGMIWFLSFIIWGSGNA